MKCAWQDYLRLLPGWMRNDVDATGCSSLQELRLRTGQPPEMMLGNRSKWLSRAVNSDDLHYVINAASQYSPWSATTAAEGYITAAGGHRVGICGDAVVENGLMRGIRNPVSVCVRVARDFPGISGKNDHYKGSVLVIGSPGSGKTTLLRDIIRQRSNYNGKCVAVVDERGELFPSSAEAFCFDTGRKTDIMRFCGKKHGIITVLKTMGPDCIAVDEITSESDCNALLHAGWCGVSLLATAHAANKNDLLSRPIYRPLIEGKLFDTLVIMMPDKSFKIERMSV